MLFMGVIDEKGAKLWNQHLLRHLIEYFDSIGSQVSRVHCDIFSFDTI